MFDQINPLIRNKFRHGLFPCRGNLRNDYRAERDGTGNSWSKWMVIDIAAEGPAAFRNAMNYSFRPDRARQGMSELYPANLQCNSAHVRRIRKVFGKKKSKKDVRRKDFLPRRKTSIRSEGEKVIPSEKKLNFEKYSHYCFHGERRNIYPLRYT